MNLIVIPTFNTTEENFNNILTLKNKFPTDTVYVVDNSKNQNDFEHHFIENNILYEKSVFGGRYEPGALLQAYQKFDAEKYVLIQDSINIKDEIFIKEYFEKDKDIIVAFLFLYPSYWFLTHENLFYLKNIFNNAEDLLDNVFGFSHSSFLCKKKHIDFMVNCKILAENYLPKNKIEQQSWERVFGIILGLSGFPVAAMSITGHPLNDEQKTHLKEKYLMKLGKPIESFYVKIHGNRA